MNRQRARIAPPFLAVIMILTSMSTQAAAPEKVADGIIVPLGGTFLKVQVCSDDILRIACSKDRAFFNRKSLAVQPAGFEPVKWSFTEDSQAATVATAKLKARVDLKSGAVSFFDADGRQILAEKKGGRTLTPAEGAGRKHTACAPAMGKQSILGDGVMYDPREVPGAVAERSAPYGWRQIVVVGVVARG
jgi:alpha-D-xyloside xylohydrolase